MAVPDSLTNARFTLQSKRIDTANSLFARETARQALEAAKRDFPAGSQQVLDAQGAYLGAQGDLDQKRSDEATARTNLNNEIANWLKVPGTQNFLTPDADLNRLANLNAPVALFPVRLETRFDIPAAKLHVRVYPDEFLSDMHERELTPDERAAGEAYWKDVRPDVDPEIPARWTPIAKQYGVPRAAYIVDAMAPFSETTFPPPRATVPSRAAEAVLPDRWVVLAFKNGELRKFKAGAPIPEPLTLTPDPSDDAQTFVEVADGFTVPTSVAWTVNYTEALNKGMAIDLDLAGDELTSGFDRVMVLGVKTSMEPEDVTQFLIDLINAHHYTRGIDLVPQGTPTNNVPGRPTPFTMTEPLAAESFQIERVGPPDGDINFDPDFYRLNDLFGFDKAFGPFRLLRESGLMRQDILDGIKMRRVLWPSTLGYFMSQMMNPEPYLNGDNGATPIFNDTDVANAKNFFLTYVSAQGPAPAFRVGAVPYGFLPAISVSRMVARTGESSAAIQVMSRLLPYWRDAASKVPTLPRNSQNPQVDLMTVISQKSRSDGAYIRNSLGVQAITNIFQLALQDFAAFVSGLAKTAPPLVGSLAHAEWAAARIFSLTFLPVVTKHAGPLVTRTPKQGKLITAIDPPPTSGDDALNYLAFLGSRTLPLNKVSNQALMPNAAPPLDQLPLLFLMARHSLLLEIVAVGRKFLPNNFQNVAPPAVKHKLLDIELFDITTTAQAPNVFDLLKVKPVGYPASLTDSVYTAIRDNKSSTNGILDSNGQVGLVQNACFDLSFKDVGDLERLTMETLDLAAHRLDAFVTALATRRLQSHRDAEREGLKTTYYGAYGFVEDVRPVARTTRQITGLGSVDVQPNNGGFIHAPSLRHATAATILRSGRMAEKSDATKYAIELPSERARRARDLIDGLRDGQSLGALLGARLERGLRERGQRENIPLMETYILALRTLYPQVGNKSGNDPGVSPDRIAARNVVDGKLVRDAAAKPGGLPFGTGNLPAGGTREAGVISNEVGRLDEIMDAVGDLAISEAIYQIAAGDVTTAEAAMNFLPQGNTPPAPEVTQTPTTGLAVNHRVALILEPTTAPAVGGWNTAGSRRGAVDAFVEDWVQRQLGNPSDLNAIVTYEFGDPPAPGTATITLDELNIAAVDFLAIAQSTAVAGQRSPLDRMIETVFRAGPAPQPTATDVQITYDTSDPAARTIPQVIELARALGAVLGSSRELAQADLRRAEDGIDDGALQPTAQALTTQAGTVLTALAAARDALTGPNVPPQALRDAARYLADAFPDPDASQAALDAAAIGTQTELARRVTDAQVALDAANASSTFAPQIAGAIQALRIVFGRNTLVVLPAAVPEGSDEIRKSLLALARPINLADPNTFDAHQAPGRFVQQAARVHERLGAWRRFTMYAGAFGAKAPLISVAQLPFVDGEDWAGRSVPTASRTSLVLVSASGQTVAPDPTTPWRGLFLDQWTELVPGGTAETGLAFHYDTQNSEAPQVILMAMHSGQAGGWNLTELQATVNETMDLARSRPVDNDMVALGQLDPPIVVASNSQNNVVSTTFGPDARQGPPIIG